MGLPASRLADLALCPSCEHGCPGCPHTVTGPAVSGSPNVFANGRPALRVGDIGMHAACCGVNMWAAVKGSETVKVNGRPWVAFGDPTQHCPGKKQQECESAAAEGGEGGEGGEGAEAPEEEEEEEEGGPGGGQGKMISGSPNVFVPGSLAELVANTALEKVMDFVIDELIGGAFPIVKTAHEWEKLSPWQPEIAFEEEEEKEGKEEGSEG